MSKWTFPRGLGSGYADCMSSANPFVVNGQLVFIDSNTTGTGISGVRQQAPLPTLTAALAYYASSANGTYAFADNHSEVLLSTVTALNHTAMLGQGSGSATAKLTWGAVTDAPMFAISTKGNLFENIWFGATPAGVSNQSYRIYITADNQVFRNCIFDCGDNDIVLATVAISGGQYCRFENCLFRSTATSIATRPKEALRLLAVATTSITLIDCTFDGGTYGWNGGTGAFAAILEGTTSYIKAIGLQTINGSRISVATTVTGFISDNSTDNASAGVSW